MSNHGYLESFERTGTSRDRQVATSAQDIERIKTETFEAGYKSGWDDAVASNKDSQKRVAAELERNIQNMTFTYSEAVDRIRAELGDFLSAFIEKFLPSLVPDLVREHVRSELLKMGDEHIELPVEIRASSNSQPLLSELLETVASSNISLVEDGSLADWQVFMQFGGKETKVDFDPLISELRSQFAAMRAETENKESRHA